MNPKYRSAATNLGEVDMDVGSPASPAEISASCLPPPRVVEDPNAEDGEREEMREIRRLELSRRKTTRKVFVRLLWLLCLVYHFLNMGLELLFYNDVVGI